MKKNLMIAGSIIVTLAASVAVYWYINFYFYEKTALERTAAYMEAQGIPKEDIAGKITLRNKQGRWEVSTALKNEPDLRYQYTYDRSGDRMLLFVYIDPNSVVEKRLLGGRTIQEGMDYPSLHKSASWVAFNKEGEPIIE